jgi:hypothetical protein
VRDGSAAATLDQAEVARVFREESGRSVATLIRVVGDIDLAEDVVQEAFAVALGKWPADGLPPNPGGWITTTARNRALDRLRRETRGRELLGEVIVQDINRILRGGPGISVTGTRRGTSTRSGATRCCAWSWWWPSAITGHARGAGRGSAFRSRTSSAWST